MAAIGTRTAVGNPMIKKRRTKTGIKRRSAPKAIIAIENKRLLNELRQRTDDLSESQQRQTAMSEVLGIISSSPEDIQPVFQALCRCARGCRKHVMGQPGGHRASGNTHRAGRTADAGRNRAWRYAPLILILSDINMPGMSGLEFLPKAKEIRPDIPVIMITAYGDAETRRKALEGGAEGLFPKPIDFASLRTEIEMRIEKTT
jgi:CheY-like chemotaxis protein